MKKLSLDIFLGERFYGTLRIPNRWGNLFAITKEEVAEIVETRLPLLKNKNYKIKL